MAPKEKVYIQNVIPAGIWMALAISNFLIFAYDIENDRDFWTWTWLLNSQICFLLTIFYFIKLVVGMNRIDAELKKEQETTSEKMKQKLIPVVGVDKLLEQELHNYNKWLTEIWNPYQFHPILMNAPKAYLKYRAEK